MNRNRRIFIVVFVFFTAIVALLAIDMASRTTAPWNKKKQAIRAFKADSAAGKIRTNDTLLLPR